MLYPLKTVANEKTEKRPFIFFEWYDQSHLHLVKLKGLNTHNSINIFQHSQNYKALYIGGWGPRPAPPTNNTNMSQQQ